MRPVPEPVGYTETFQETEFGVFADRRRQGHGFALLGTTRSHNEAREYAERATDATDDDVFIRRRVVTYTPWATPGVVHDCPVGDSPTTPCCGRIVFELPPTDRIAAAPGRVTCTG